MAHLPSKPSALACDAGPAVPLGILVGGIRARRWRRPTRPGRGQHLHPGEVPEVTGVVDERVEVPVHPGVQRGRQVARAEDQRFEPWAGLGDLASIGDLPPPQ